MSKSKTARLLVASALLTMAGTGIATADEPGVTADTIKIGTFGALTGPGYLYGKLPMNGMEIIFDQVNAAGGIHGRKLELVREDDRCDPATAITAVQKLISQDKVFAIIGGGCSNPTLAAKETLENAKIPTIIHASTHDGITDPVAENIFSAATSSTIESKAQVDFALQQGAKKIAIISMRDAWGRARYNPLVEEMKRRGIEIIADEEMVPDANDATAQVLRLKAAGADAVMVILFPKPAAVFMRDAFKLGYKPLMIGQTGIADPAALEEQVGIPGATETFRTISMVRYVPEDPEVEKYRKAIEAKFPGDRLSPFNLFGIGSAQIMVAALKEAGPDLTQEKVIEALSNMNLEVDVYGGPITCTKTDHRCNKSPAWLQKAPGGETKVIGITRVE